MTILEIKVPNLPESVADATIAKWYKKPGERVARDENILDLETDKVMLEVPSIQEGVLKEILKPEGSVVKTGELLARVEVGASAAAAAKAPAAVKTQEVSSEAPTSEKEAPAGPSARRVAAEHAVAPEALVGSGKKGRVQKEDVITHVTTAAAGKTASPTSPSVATSSAALSSPASLGGREEKRVPMSRLRARIAERLVSAQQNAALLTTFNEIDMKPVMDLRNKYKEVFTKHHGAKLGFMSFFVKAAVEALKRFPLVNASIDGTDIVYHNYFDIGVAIGSERGLVVPILRNAESLSMADMEKAIVKFAEQAKEGKLALEDLQGGTFSITNGGTYGSMMSTPIVNPPQSAILGMHAITERAVVQNQQIVIRPMMYVALSYDHRIVDGREAVQFLVTIKQILEDPTRLLLEV